MVTRLYHQYGEWEYPGGWDDRGGDEGSLPNWEMLTELCPRLSSTEQLIVKHCHILSNSLGPFLSQPSLLSLEAGVFDNVNLKL